MGKTGTILDKIVEVKHKDLVAAKASISVEELKARAEEQAPARSLIAALKESLGVALIAEVKKASPSRGVLVENFDPVSLARTYAENGAAAISVLTETPHFQGRLQFMADIKISLGPSCPPLLRKDFIFDPYQALEARAWGADAILLIAAILDEDDMRRLLQAARDLGMDSLVETHTESELRAALAAGATLVGINNRDLKTFDVDLQTTRSLMPLVPAGVPVVAESGIFTRDDVAMVADWGVEAILVGEGLVKSGDVAARVRELATVQPAKVGSP